MVRFNQKILPLVLEGIDTPLKLKLHRQAALLGPKIMYTDFLSSSKTTLKMSTQQFSPPHKIVKMILSVFQNLTQNVDFRGHISALNAEKITKIGFLTYRNVI